MLTSINISSHLHLLVAHQIQDLSSVECILLRHFLQLYQKS